MHLNGERDFVGYGKHPPDPRWPDGAKLALNFVINVEEGGEPSMPDGAARSESALTELGPQPSDVRGRDLAAESMFEYGSRVAAWRVFGLFASAGLPCTVFACAEALRRNPALCAEIREFDHDVCAHGFRWEKHYELDDATERTRIRDTVESIRETVGARPLGWYCRYGPSLNTRRLLVEEGGFVYDSDSYADELPFWMSVGGKPHLVVPYSLATNDTKFVRGGIATSAQFYEFLRDSVEVLLAEGVRTPKMMSIGLHLRLVGHPGRFKGLQQFVRWLQEQDGVWIARRIDIARHWMSTHSPDQRQSGDEPIPGVDA
ncbi:MAG: polysaccharide deacetylase family protein [Gammaproteobacteria bacterium]|nr:polysaccharide deacetylase family protein [Gammaproteobacteria bacterium]